MPPPDVVLLGDKLLANAGDLAPGNLGMSVYELGRDTTGRLPKHFKFTNDSVLNYPVPVECFAISSGQQLRKAVVWRTATVNVPEVDPLLRVAAATLGGVAAPEVTSRDSDPGFWAKVKEALGGG